jgi:hypothetical protein
MARHQSSEPNLRVSRAELAKPPPERQPGSLAGPTLPWDSKCAAAPISTGVDVVELGEFVLVRAGEVVRQLEKFVHVFPSAMIQRSKLRVPEILKLRLTDTFKQVGKARNLIRDVNDVINFTRCVLALRSTYG